MDISVSIIIVNYNTEKVLEDCIFSIKEKTSNAGYEIIVIDNNSEQGSLNHLIELFPDVKFVLTGKNPGFGAANNIGANMARGKYLFFLNPDTLVINNAVYELSQYMDAHPNTGACGGNMYSADMEPVSSYYIDIIKAEYRIVFNRKKIIGFNYNSKPKFVNVIVGADLLVRKDVFMKAGGFDEDFFMYYEEVELCQRIQKLGYKIVSVPAAEIIHLQGVSAENKSDELQKWSYKEHWYSKFLYFYKVKGKFHAGLLYYINMLKLQLAVILYKIKNNPDKLRYWDIKKRVMQETFNRYRKYLKSKE
jgi:GT2 family glycosyltransferase